MKRLLFVLLAVGCVGISVPTAQMRVTPIDEVQGHAALGLALRHLGNAGIFMMKASVALDLRHPNRGPVTLRALLAPLAAARRGHCPQLGDSSSCAMSSLRKEPD